MNKTDLPAITLQKHPKIASSAFIARGAQIIGNVCLKADASVWYNAVLRGDINYIAVGERSNLQDGTIVHLENELSCIVGDDVTVGHGAILHGCRIEDGCLIGMGAIILSGVTIKKGSVIAAGAVVLENTIVEPFSLMAGVPAKLIRKVSETTYQQNLDWANKYVQLARLYQQKNMGISKDTEAILPNSNK